MIRLHVLTSARIDQDAEAQLETLSHLPRVELLRSHRPVADNLALIARTACSVWSRSDEADVVVTVGEAALTAALLSWRGPLVHLGAGRLTDGEVRLLRWRGQHARFADVFSSHIAATDAIRRGLPSESTRVIRTAPPALFATRDEIRQKLGIAPGAICLLINGRINSVGGHRTALLTSAVLAFRDPSWRVLIDAGRQTDYVRRFFANTSQPQSLVLCDQCSPAELAAAADVVVIDDRAVPSLVGIASAAAARVPIVASTRTWQREQLSHVPAMLISCSTARFWARAVLQSIDGAQSDQLDRLASSMSASVGEASLRHQWLEVLHAVCGRTQSGLATNGHRPHSSTLQSSP